MKLSDAFSVFGQIYMFVKIAFLPTIKSIWLKPSLLWTPRAISQMFVASVWAAGMGDGIDEKRRHIKTQLITPNAHGVVLDLGAGHGHTAQYLDRTKVTHYIALEPNGQMHSFIRAAASAAGFFESDGTFVLLPFGAEDTTSILSALNGRPADTIISVLTLCCVPSPQRTIGNLVRDVLQPNGGVFLFYEHVLSPRPDVAWWQRFWAPLWEIVFDRCRMDSPTHLYIRDVEVVGDGGVKATPWAEVSIYGEPGVPDDDSEHLFWHQLGKLVKK